VTLTQDQIQRYSRHLLLPQVGAEGQARLLESSVLVAFSPRARGTAEALAVYLAGAGVGRIGWCALGGGSAAGPGSLAGLLGTYSPAGPGAALQAINPDSRLEVIECGGNWERRGGRLALLLGEGPEAEAFGGKCRAAGMTVLRGRLSGMSGAVLGEVAADDGFGEADAGGEADEALPTAPAEGALGSLLAAAAVRVLLGEVPAGSAGFDFEKGRLWGRAAAGA
jgi:hypothetical protein